MSRFDPDTRKPSPTSAPFLELAQRLEDLGIPAWQQGEALVADLLTGPGDPADPATVPARAARDAAPVLLCAAPAASVLEALPRAVVTSSEHQRISLGTSSGPIDLIPIGEEAIESVLPRFGLSALCIAWRAIGERWCDPVDGLGALSRGQLDACGAHDDERTNAFSLAPRRFWIAARLLAEFGLEATPHLVACARSALEACRRSLPEGAPARREIERILAAPRVETGLGFLHEVGLCNLVFPGMNAAGPEIVAALDREPSLRWAAWLSGAAPQRAMRRLRMPLGRARRIERLLRYHPIERTAQAAGEIGIRRLRQRLQPEELEGLLHWRNHQLERAGESAEAMADRAGLERLRTQLDSLGREQQRHDRIRALAIDGDRVMTILDRGPGRHVGRALAHLARFIEQSPDRNDGQQLEAELREWAEQNPE